MDVLDSQILSAERAAVRALFEPVVAAERLFAEWNASPESTIRETVRLVLALAPMLKDVATRLDGAEQAILRLLQSSAVVH